MTTIVVTLILASRKRMVLIGIITLVSAVIGIILFGFLTAADRSVLLGRYKTFTHNDFQRQYLLHVPREISDDTIVIVGLHGFGGNARQYAYYTALHNLDDNAVFIYPNAIERSNENLSSGWNASFCCGAGWQKDIDDVGFIRELSLSIAKQYGVSTEKLFVSGFSNGAFMTQRIAAEDPANYVAVASVSGAIGANDIMLEPKSPIPIYLSHGGKDETIPLEGGAGKTDPNFAWRSHGETVAAWQAVNANTNTAVEVDVFPEDTHRWHDWRLANIWHRQPDGSKRVIDFFRAQ